MQLLKLMIFVSDAGGRIEESKGVESRSKARAMETAGRVTYAMPSDCGRSEK